MLSGDQGGSHRTANGIIDKIPFEEHTLFCEPVNIGGGDELFVISADRVGIMVIAHYINDIGPLLGKNQLGTAAKQEGEEPHSLFFERYKQSVQYYSECGKEAGIDRTDHSFIILLAGPYCIYGPGFHFIIREFIMNDFV